MKTRAVASSSKGTKEKKGKEKYDGNEPSSPPYLSSSSLFSYHSSSDSDSQKKPNKTHFLKLDVKFALPTYDSEMNPEKLDNWIQQLEVYCRIQNIVD